jgi:hypothetical protein
MTKDLLVALSSGLTRQPPRKNEQTSLPMPILGCQQHIETGRIREMAKRGAQKNLPAPIFSVGSSALLSPALNIPSPGRLLAWQAHRIQQTNYTSDSLYVKCIQ